MSRAYLQFTKADCYDIYIWCNQETQHALQHLATLQQQSFATAVVCTCPYLPMFCPPHPWILCSTETTNQPRPDKEVTVLFSKNSDSGDQRFELMRSDFSHSQSFSVIFTSLAVLIFQNCCQVLRRKWIRSVNLK